MSSSQSESPIPTPANAVAIEDRLHGLERSHRRFEAATVILGLLIALALAWQLLPVRALQEAKRFVVRGSGGIPRAELSEWSDGSVALRLNDARGKAKAMWRLSADGSVVLYLADAAGHRRLELATAPDGDPTIILAGSDGRSRVALAAPLEGRRSGVALRDSLGRVTFRAP
jgi:hypothetical protein